jgi:NAD(P)-dependent dehydrogenase (short-subunit alcohol dehydrogenase family)
VSSIRVDFSGKVIAVTGAFGALGAAVAATLADFGARVARLDHAPVPPGSPSGSLSYGGIDLADDAAAASAIGQIVQETGRLDGLVNIAGGFRFEKLEQGTLETWDSLYRMNLRTAVACCKAALPHHQHRRAWRREGERRHGRLCGLEGRNREVNRGTRR